MVKRCGLSNDWSMASPVGKEGSVEVEREEEG